MIDLHSHILPGLDDGAESLELALEMARAAVADGIGTIAATPHVRADDYPTRPEAMEAGVEELRAALREAEIPLELLPGGELSLEMLLRLDDTALRRFGLGGNPNCLLIETPYLGWPIGIEELFFQLRLRRFTVVLAHPERNDEVQAHPERLERLVESGTLVQLTAASVDGRLGPPPRKTALRLLELGFAHMLASDAHAPTVRQVGLSGATSSLGDPEFAEWLTDRVPSAIVEGRPVPDRPERRPQRRFRLPGFRG